MSVLATVLIAWGSAFVGFFIAALMCAAGREGNIPGKRD